MMALGCSCHINIWWERGKKGQDAELSKDSSTRSVISILGKLEVYYHTCTPTTGKKKCGTCVRIAIYVLKLGVKLTRGYVFFTSVR